MYTLEEHTSPITAICLLKDYVGGAYGGGMANDDVISIMSTSNNEMIKWELATADERLDSTNSFTRIVEHQGKINVSSDKWVWSLREWLLLYDTFIMCITCDYNYFQSLWDYSIRV